MLTKSYAMESVRIKEASPSQCLLKPECFVIENSTFSKIIMKSHVENSARQ